MRILSVFLLLTTIFASCSDKKSNQNDQLSSLPSIWQANDIYKVVDRLHQETDTTYVINLWASWCKPCIEELPFFLAVAQEKRNEKWKFLFVSLDFPEQYEKKLIPFVNKNMKGQEVIHLLHSDFNDLLPVANKRWDGSIPATWVVRGDKSIFKESNFESEEELIEFVLSID